MNKQLGGIRKTNPSRGVRIDRKLAYLVEASLFTVLVCFGGCWARLEENSTSSFCHGMETCPLNVWVFWQLTGEQRFKIILKLWLK